MIYRVLLADPARTGLRVLWRGLRALVQAASAKQLAVVAVIVVGGLLVLVDAVANDGSESPPAATAEPPLVHEPDGLMTVVVEDAAFVRFIGFSLLSVALLIGVFVLLWRLANRADPP